MATPDGVLTSEQKTRRQVNVNVYHMTKDGVFAYNNSNVDSRNYWVLKLIITDQCETRST